jgi:hypothetical protein
VNKLGRFSRLSRRDRILTYEAAVTLWFARLWLAIVPFRKVAERLGTSYPAAAPKNMLVPTTEKDDMVARQVGEAVIRASKNVPYKAVCIQQAVAAKIMLGRRGIPSVMHFGVGRTDDEDEKMRAHAWLATANVEVTGYPLDEGLTEIAYFV